MKTLLVEAQLESYRRVKDGSMKLTFGTMREMSTDELTSIDKYYQHRGWLAFKMDEFDSTEIPTEDTKVKGKLSPAQMLRYALFAKHLNTGGVKETFPAYYAKAMAGFEQAVNDSYD